MLKLHYFGSRILAPTKPKTTPFWALKLYIFSLKNKEKKSGWLEPPLPPVWGWSNHPHSQGVARPPPKGKKEKKRKRNGLWGWPQPPGSSHPLGQKWGGSATPFWSRSGWSHSIYLFFNFSFLFLFFLNRCPRRCYFGLGVTSLA
jgi:hypothetical protein